MSANPVVISKMIAGPAGPTSVPINGNSVDASGAITTGATAQNVFGTTIPSNGFAIYNVDATNDLWVSDTTTAAANNTGSIRVPANGGFYETPNFYSPIGIVSIIGGTTGQKFTAKRW